MEKKNKKSEKNNNNNSNNSVNTVTLPNNNNVNIINPEHNKSKGNRSLLMSHVFKTAEEVVASFNDVNILEVDKIYLKNLISTIITIFKQQSTKTKDLIEAFLPLAAAEDNEIFSNVINLLGKLLKDNDIVVDNFALKALLQAVWMNKKEILHLDALKRLLRISIDKIDLNADNLYLFCNLFDAMIRDNVTGIDKDLRHELEVKFQTMLGQVVNDKTWKLVDTKEELIFRIQYAYQALLRIGTDETESEKFKRRFMAAINGLTKLAGAATSIASVAVTAGASAAFSIPGAIESLISSVSNFEEAFHKKKKRSWYTNLKILQSALIEKAWEKDSYDINEIFEMKQQFDLLMKKNFGPHVKYGIIDTLKQIIEYHPDELVKNLGFTILTNYLDDKNTQIKVLSTFAEISIRVPSLTKIITEKVSKINLKSKYDDLLSQVKNNLKESTPLDFQLVSISQNTLNTMLKNNNPQSIQAVTKATLKMAVVEDGAKSEGGECNGNKQHLIHMKNPEGISAKERAETVEHMNSMINQIFAAANEIKLVVLEKGSITTNTTVNNNEQALIYDEKVERQFTNVAKDINNIREKSGFHLSNSKKTTDSQNHSPINEDRDTDEFSNEEKKTIKPKQF